MNALISIDAPIVLAAVAFEVTGIAKAGGPLTKRISLNKDGKLISDGSACVMTVGHAIRQPFDTMDDFADLLVSLDPNEAIALGAIRHDLPDTVKVTTQDRLAKLNSEAPPDLIARNSTHIGYDPGRAALALIDIDTKGMPATVRNSIEAAGGYWPALVSVIPELEATARVVRRSTSTGISRTDTGEAMPGSNGLHIYLLVQDGADIERFLRTFHERCWLAGLGWHMVGAGGQLLDRSLVDKMVYAGERLVFEGAPVLVPPLVQDVEARRPTVYEGAALDTRSACPALSLVEKSKLDEVKAKSGHGMKPERAKAREEFIDAQSAKLTKRTGKSGMEARKIIERQCDGFLLPSVELPFDDEAFAGCTVNDVMKDPARFVGATMADPLEGVEYGRTKAMVMRQADGSPWIHSFAHGRTVYSLKYDAKTAAEIIDGTPPDQMADAFVEVALIADLDPDETEMLRNKVAAAAGVTKRAIDRKLKNAITEAAGRHKAEERERRAAERTDHRPQIAAPEESAPWIPQMDVLNDVLGSCNESEPPMRDVEGYLTHVMVKRVPGMHKLTSDSANGGTAKPVDDDEQPLLHRMDDLSASEMIERHIDYTDPTGKSVHLGMQFARRFVQRHDHKLPTVVSVATLPVVLPGGRLHAPIGLDRTSGTVFRIPLNIAKIIPNPEECTPERAKAALKFLLNEWLHDVLTDDAGKCALVSAAMTIIQRVLLPGRPAFMLSAGKRGGGKTTTLQMLGLAATGVEPSAASWSDNTEERRKALMSYFVAGVPLIIWDNIELGTEIYCPHIEKALTSPTVADRILGETRREVVPSTCIHLFTGNNILPIGDLASRTLHVKLDVKTADPENRKFKHRDPLAWTRQNREKILRAMYVVMLAEPNVTNDGAHGRFSMWWRLVGRPVENAARSMGVSVDFGQMFLDNEVVDESVQNITDVLIAMTEQWQEKAFGASDIATLLNDESNQKTNEAKGRAETIRDILFPRDAGDKKVSPKSIGRLLKKYVGTPVKMPDGATMRLERGTDTIANTTVYRVARLP